MALFVPPPVTAAFKFCAFPGGYHRFSAMVIDIIYECMAVITFVCKDKAPLQPDMVQQGDGHGYIIALPSAEEQEDWVPV